MLKWEKGGGLFKEKQERKTSGMCKRGEVVAVVRFFINQKEIIYIFPHFSGSSTSSIYSPPSDAEVEDSEGDEVVDIERIEDREEDAGEDNKNSQVYNFKHSFNLPSWC